MVETCIFGRIYAICKISGIDTFPYDCFFTRWSTDPLDELVVCVCLLSQCMYAYPCVNVVSKFYSMSAEVREQPDIGHHFVFGLKQGPLGFWSISCLCISFPYRCTRMIAPDSNTALRGNGTQMNHHANSKGLYPLSHLPSSGFLRVKTMVCLCSFPESLQREQIDLLGSLERHVST